MIWNARSERSRPAYMGPWVVMAKFLRVSAYYMRLQECVHDACARVRARYGSNAVICSSWILYNVGKTCGGNLFLDGLRSLSRSVDASNVDIKRAHFAFRSYGRRSRLGRSSFALLVNEKLDSRYYAIDEKRKCVDNVNDHFFTSFLPRIVSSDCFLQVGLTIGRDTRCDASRSLQSIGKISACKEEQAKAESIKLHRPASDWREIQTEASLWASLLLRSKRLACACENHVKRCPIVSQN